MSRKKGGLTLGNRALNTTGPLRKHLRRTANPRLYPLYVFFGGLWLFFVRGKQKKVESRRREKAAGQSSRNQPSRPPYWAMNRLYASLSTPASGSSPRWACLM